MPTQQWGIDQAIGHPPTPPHSSIHMDKYLHGFHCGISQGWEQSIIMVVVDRLSKYAHFCALPQQFTTSMVTQLFLNQIFKLHGMPTSIVSDRDTTFTRKF